MNRQSNFDFHDKFQRFFPKGRRYFAPRSPQPTHPITHPGPIDATVIKQLKHNAGGSDNLKVDFDGDFFPFIKLCANQVVFHIHNLNVKACTILKHTEAINVS
jgi:hypothetical protein